jgi:ATP-dependent HslUV protease ATP-binding subunit HslU
MERLLETVSFEASDAMNSKETLVDKQYVNNHLGELVQDEDLSRYIL